MIKLTDLTGITTTKIEEIVQCLNSLLNFKDDAGNLAPVISGYNWYIKTFDKPGTTITFSHMHETESYLEAMLNDLKMQGYKPEALREQIRQKASAFLWDSNYSIRDDRGKLLNLEIKDLATRQYIPLERYGSALIEHQAFSHSQGTLVAEAYGWEIDMLCSGINLGVFPLLLRRLKKN